MRYVFLLFSLLAATTHAQVLDIDQRPVSGTGASFYGPVGCANLDNATTAGCAIVDAVDVAAQQTLILPIQVSGPEKTAGTDTALRSFAPKDIADMAGTHGGGGGGGLTQSKVSPTTDDIIGVAGTHYVIDATNYANDIAVVFPECTDEEQIQVTLVKGNGSWETDIKGSTGVSINQAAAGTTWSRLLIGRETILAECTKGSANEWTIVTDGRAPCIAKMSNSVAQTGIAYAGWRTIEFNVMRVNNCGIASLTTNDIVARRAAKAYTCSANVALDNLGAGKVAYSKIGGNPIAFSYINETTSEAEPHHLPIGGYVSTDVTVGTTFKYLVYHNDSGSTLSTAVPSTDWYPFLSCTEVLSP